ncbi:MAG: PAS domain-containing protein [Myxococcota bacterium]
MAKILEALWAIKSTVGVDASETPRDVAFCDHAIRQHEPTLVHDARLDPRFSSNPFVTGAPYIRFDAGFPLVSPCGTAVGTLCVLGPTPKTLTEDQVASLSDLANHVESLLELRRAVFEQDRALRTLEGVIDNAPVMMFLKDPESLKVTLWNRTAERLSGVRREDILGKTGLESFPPEEMEGFLAADRKAVREQAVIEKEESMTGPAGTVKLCTKKLPILDSSNQPLSLLGLSLDVTELRARENDLLEASRLLEEKVAERTAEFEKQGALLRRTQRLDALGRLAGGVAHDFNNLLCVVLGNASELLEESLDAETVRDLIQEIDTAARRAGQLTSQLLAFGGNQVLDPKPVDVEELLDNCWQLLERLVPPSIKLRRVRAEALPRIDVDMGQNRWHRPGACDGARNRSPKRRANRRRVKGRARYDVLRGFPPKPKHARGVFTEAPSEHGQPGSNAGLPSNSGGRRRSAGA